jgi:hypothetical protein
MCTDLGANVKTLLGAVSLLLYLFLLDHICSEN